MTFYELLGRLVSPPVLFVLRLLTRVHRTVRVRVLIRNDHGEILLVKNWIGKNEWEMPGGGVGKKEDTYDAALREVHEETGIQLKRADLREVATYLGRYETCVFEAVATPLQLAAMKRRKWEITHLGWYAPSALPQPLAWNVKQTLSKLPK
jgi:8-oxo-dGTP pyrophosphatase MutT (NUDIX family)